jgi:hypothetical protein
MVKYTAALKKGTAEAEAILSRFTKNGPQHPVYKAEIFKLPLLRLLSVAAIGFSLIISSILITLCCL